MTLPTPLAVLINGEAVGFLHLDNANHIFEYDQRYQARDDATPLSISLPLARRTHTGSAVTNFLWGLLPDNDRVLERWGLQFDVSPRNPFGLLANVGEDCAGAVQFIRSERTEKSEAGTVEWVSEADIAMRIRSIRTDNAAWLPPRGTNGYHSLAGARPKFALARDGDRWGIPGGARPTTHILKPNTGPFVDFDLNEHLCLDAANRLRIRAARSAMVEFMDERILVVERFDRVPGTNRRLHQEDMCQALGVHPLRKYQSDHGPAVIDVARLLRENSTGAIDVDIRAFVDALAFSWLTMGTDAHAKNYSLLLSGAQVRFAPLYDLSSALPYQLARPTKPMPGELAATGLRLAMKIGGRYEITDLRADNWHLLADEVGLEREEVVERVIGLASAVADAFSAAVSQTKGASESTIAIALIDRVARHATRCLGWIRSSTRRKDR
jgi:serine/threonine-protein kinase HipA